MGIVFVDVALVLVDIVPSKKWFVFEKESTMYCTIKIVDESAHLFQIF